MRRALASLALVGSILAGVPVAAAPTEPHARLAGDDRFATSAAISRANASPGVDVVYVATGRAFADALTAGAAGRPVLLVERDSIPPSVAAELDRLDPRSIVVLGGLAAVGPAVEQQLARYTDGDVVRVAGTDRFETAARLSARNHAGGATTAYVVSGEAFPDALSAGAAAVGVRHDRRGDDQPVVEWDMRGPVLLVTRDAVPPATAAELERLAPDHVVIVGGTAAVGEGVAAQLAALSRADVHRAAGDDRYATSVALSQLAFRGGVDDLYLASGTSFADALAAGWAAGRAGSPLLLARRTCVPRRVITEIDRVQARRIVLVGGTASLTDDAGRLRPCDAATVTVIATGLQVPWDVAFAPGGVAYVTERDSGRVLQRTPDGGITEAHRFVVDPAGEGGLLGLAPSPSFASDGLLYAFMTTATDNRIVRFRPGDRTSETVILSGIPKASIHDAGRIAFGPDGMLYATTGDATVTSRSQDRTNLAGKVLRMRPDGSAPGDNPLGGLVYAMGLRDPQGITWRADGLGYVTEFGPDRDDEVNVLRAGANYGWPVVTGVANRQGFDDPVVVRQPPVASWSGAAIVRGGVAEWDGDLLVAALRGQRLYRFDLRPDGTVIGAGEELFVGTYGRLRHVEQAPDGSLWILTSNRDGRGSPVADDDRIIRIGPP